jgi:hypothetical protein
MDRRDGLQGRGEWSSNLPLRPSGGSLGASRRKIRAQHELAPETAGFETSVRLDNFIQRDPLGDARLDGGTGQQSEKTLQVLPEPLGMLQPHRVDGVERGSPSARQQPPEIQARNPHQHGGHASPTLHARRVAISAEQTARLERRERVAIAVFPDAVEDDVEPAWQDTREVFALVVDQRGPELADQRGVRPSGPAPQLKPGHATEYEQRLADCTRGSVHKYALPSLHLRSAVKELVRGHPTQDQIAASAASTPAGTGVKWLAWSVR